MIVLGLNGKLDGHDPAAALIVDGQLIASVEEERFTGRRHEPGGMPHYASAWALDRAGLSLDDVDIIALGWDPRRQADAPEPDDDDALLDMLLPRRWFPRTARPALVRVPHHHAHAAAGWASAGCADAAVLVMDGSGEAESSSGWSAGSAGLHKLWDLPYATSLGFFYQALTEFVGMSMFDEGKTMGLAAWGEPRWELPSALDAPAADPVAPADTAHYLSLVRGWRRIFQHATGLRPNPRRARFSPETFTLRRGAESFPQPYRDVAATGQRRLEQDAVALARRVLAETGAPALILSGGVALNCVANGALQAAIAPRVLHVPPACHDGGVALGAAAAVSWDGGRPVVLDEAHVYSGPDFSAGAVHDLLAGWGLGPLAVPDPVDAVVNLLREGASVAWFSGRAELGPRALGARSILADPSKPGALDRINALKRREPWRPLGPSLTPAAAEAVFGRPIQAPYMLVTHHVPDAARAGITATVHVDGTTRPQVVKPASNPRYHELLDRFWHRTGVPALVNTSFNVDGPIVTTPAQAVRTFFSSPLDALLIGDSLLIKDPVLNPRKGRR